MLLTRHPQVIGRTIGQKGNPLLVAKTETETPEMPEMTGSEVAMMAAGTAETAERGTRSPRLRQQILSRSCCNWCRATKVGTCFGLKPWIPRSAP